MYCPKCGRQISEDSNLCPYCAQGIKGMSGGPRNGNVRRYTRLIIFVLVAIGVIAISAIVMVVVQRTKDIGPDGTYYYYDEDTGIVHMDRGMVFENGSIYDAETGEWNTNYQYEDGIIKTIGNDGVYHSTYDKEYDRIYINVDHMWYIKPDDEWIKEKEVALTDMEENTQTNGVEEQVVMQIETEEMGTENQDNRESKEDEDIVTVAFLLHDEPGEGVWADVKGMNESNVVWENETGVYISTEPPLIAVIGQRGNDFYYAENYTVRKIDARSGATIWQTAILDGMPMAGGVIGSDGRIYISCGYASDPDFCVISPNGEILYQIKNFGDDYYGIGIDKYEDGKVFLDADAYETGEPIVFEVDTNSYEWVRY